MEESYTVHRRRKAAAAARKREKTPEPSARNRFIEISEDEEDGRRARMEKMAQDTEQMEDRQKEALVSEKQQRQSESDDLRVALSNTDENKSLTGSNRGPASWCVIENNAKGRDADGTDGIEVPTTSDKSMELARSTDGAGNARHAFTDETLETKLAAYKEINRNVEMLENVESQGGGTGRKRSGKRNAGYERSPLTEAENRRAPRKSTSRRHARPVVNDEVVIVKKEETDGKAPAPAPTPTPVAATKSRGKQIIPLSNESLIEDLAKAQEVYTYARTRARGILDSDSDTDLSGTSIGRGSGRAAPRRRKTSPSRANLLPAGEDTSSNDKETRISRGSAWLSWLSWLSWRVPFRPSAKGSDEDGERKGQETPPLVGGPPAMPVSAPHHAGTWGIVRDQFAAFLARNTDELSIMRGLRNRCFAELILMLIYCGLGAFVFRFTEGAFETFYKCGVKRVKRDFLDSLWSYSHNLREDEWKSIARKKLMEFEEQLHAAHEAGVHSYSGQKSWSFLNALVYCITVVTTIGYGHIAPSTTTGRAITIVYAIFGIPIFLIILADFGKLFTRGIKFLWAFVRRLYYTGSCRKVRRTGPVQEVMKGVQLVYDFATFRRPSQLNPDEIEEIQRQQQQQHQQPPATVLGLDGNIAPDTPGTPAMSAFAVDDEFNLPISVAIFILVLYIFVGATLYCLMEGWGFFESFYFVFVSMSTIGFGDYVPKNPISMMGSIVYMVFGLALTSMCINVVQVMLSDSFRQASQKIGATIGFEVAEEDGSVKPSPVPDIELPDVHATIRETESTEKVAPKAKQEDLDI